MSKKRIRKIKRSPAMERLAQKKVSKQAALMMQTPKECFVCNKPFDKTSETVKEWKIAVYEDRKILKLYCPQCWKQAKDVVDAFKEHEEDLNQEKTEQEVEDGQENAESNV